MGKGVPHSPELKARALADLLVGDPISVVAERYEVPEGTIKLWSAQRGRVVPVQPENKEELGALVGAVLTANLRGLRAIAELAEDGVWTRRQDADKLAIFYGVIADKSVRILSGLRPSAPEAPTVQDVPEDEGPHH